MHTNHMAVSRARKSAVALGIALVAVAPALAGVPSAHDEQAVMVAVQQLPHRQQSPITRESVRAELFAARAAGTLTQANEAGDTERTLNARDAANDEQVASIIAEYQAEYDRQAALQEADIRRAEIEANWLAYGVAQASTAAGVINDDAMAEVQIDVISLQPKAVGE